MCQLFIQRHNLNRSCSQKKHFPQINDLLITTWAVIWRLTLRIFVKRKAFKILGLESSVPSCKAANFRSLFTTFRRSAFLLLKLSIITYGTAGFLSLAASCPWQHAGKHKYVRIMYEFLSSKVCYNVIPFFFRNILYVFHNTIIRITSKTFVR